MKAVILCAGEGERLKPITSSVPKPLVRIENKPILAYILNSLPNEISEVFLVIKEKHKFPFETFLKDNPFKVKIDVLFQDPEKQGTYFALMAAKEFLEKEDKFLVLNGDDLFLKEDLEDLLKLEAPAYGLSYKKMDERYRTCEIDPDNKKIVSFRKQMDHEKDEEVLCFSGALTLTNEFFQYEPAYIGKEAGIPDTLFSVNVPVSHLILKKWFQVNTLEDLIYVKKNLSLFS